MSKKHFVKRALPMTLAAAMVFTSVPVMAAPNDLSVRVVEKLENGGRGLNLTFEVRDGIRNHR